MSVEQRICDYCKDVILGSKEDVYLVQKGYINKYNEFQALGENEVRHEKCHKLIEARAAIMADISVLIFKKEDLL